MLGIFSSEVYCFCEHHAEVKTKRLCILQVKVFAGNPKGIVSVKFKTEEGAQACLNKMNGRFFGGRQVVAKLWDGFTNYNVKLQESEEQIQARREQFAREIEAQEVEEKLKREQNDAPSLQVEANTWVSEK